MGEVYTFPTADGPVTVREVGVRWTYARLAAVALAGAVKELGGIRPTLRFYRHLAGDPAMRGLATPGDRAGDLWIRADLSPEQLVMTVRHEAAHVAGAALSHKAIRAYAARQSRKAVKRVKAARADRVAGVVDRVRLELLADIRASR